MVDRWIGDEVESCYLTGGIVALVEHVKAIVSVNLLTRFLANLTVRAIVVGVN